MKVGTDSVLLGAWCLFPSVSRVEALDVGCGSGILSLMLAQRGASYVQAIDVEPGAVSQAQENVDESRWKDCIKVTQADIRSFRPEKKYSLVVCNPPFYKERTCAGTHGRQLARHTDSLDFRELMESVVCLLDEKGVFSLIIPSSCEPEIRGLAVELGLHPYASLRVCTQEGKAPKRVLLAFGYSEERTEQRKTLMIKDASGQFTEDYKRLTDDFYLSL